jgi:hypothetical protein
MGATCHNCAATLARQTKVLTLSGVSRHAETLENAGDPNR